MNKDDKKNGMDLAAVILVGLIKAAVGPWLLIWATNTLRPEIAWLPHLTFWSALALMYLVYFIRPYGASVTK